jgi:hypothetical protein
MSHSKDLYISGGEPFMDPRMESFLDCLLSDKCQPKREINIQTNLSSDRIFQDKFLSRLSKLDSLCLSISIDGVGKKGEFIRKGLDWKIFTDNLLRLEQTLPQAKLILTPTISIYNAYHILEVFEYFFGLKDKFEYQ